MELILLTDEDIDRALQHSAPKKKPRLKLTAKEFNPGNGSGSLNSYTSELSTRGPPGLLPNE